MHDCKSSRSGTLTRTTEETPKLHAIKRSSLSCNRIPLPSVAHAWNSDKHRPITQHWKLAVNNKDWNTAEDVRARPAAPCIAAAAALQHTWISFEKAAAPGRLACYWQRSLVTYLWKGDGVTGSRKGGGHMRREEDGASGTNIPASRSFARVICKQIQGRGSL